jgi:ion channel POLLUX/CASTOR
MRKITFSQRFQYWFDNYMARGAGALIGGLAIVSVALIALAALIMVIAGKLLAPNDADPYDFGEAMWQSLMRTLDAGTMGGDEGWGFRWLMLLVTIGGIFIVSSLIGVLTSGLEERLQTLRKGRSQVLENEHTVILGWSPQIFNIIAELVIANENRKKGAAIAILAEKDKVEMEDEIREYVGDLKNTRVICRSGTPMDLNDLEIVSPHTARAIIILPPHDSANPDNYIIKSVLAITNNPARHAEPYTIVTQVRDDSNLEVIKLLSTRDNVCPIVTSDVISRVLAQTSRQSGLSVVYTELMNFSGDEIYFAEAPALTGKTFGEAIHDFEDCAPLGIRKQHSGEILLNPPMDARIEPGDQIIAIARDDDMLKVSSAPQPVDENALAPSADAPALASPEKCLILDWNRAAPTIINELDHYVPAGSHVTVVADAEFEADVQKHTESLQNQRTTFIAGDTTSRALLNSLEVFDYDHVIALANSDLPAQEADARTLVTLLHLRDIVQHDETPFSIVSEMLDLRNRELAEVTKVDDFIVSDHLVGLMMAQLAEHAELFHVFTDIFEPEGAEIYLKPIRDYVQPGKPVTMYTLFEAARRRGQTPIGYRIAAEQNNPDNAYGVHTNPHKSTLVTFAPEDKIIVLAEE